jgi:hypothetical protein
MVVPVYVDEEGALLAVKAMMNDELNQSSCCPHQHHLQRTVRSQQRQISVIDPRLLPLQVRRIEDETLVMITKNADDVDAEYRARRLSVIHPEVSPRQANMASMPKMAMGYSSREEGFHHDRSLMVSGPPAPVSEDQ